MSFPDTDCIVMCDIPLCTGCEWYWDGLERSRVSHGWRMDVAGLLACRKRRLVTR